MSLFPRNRAERARAAALMERRRGTLERRYNRLLAKELRRANKEAADVYEVSGSTSAVEQTIVDHRRRMRELLSDLYERSIRSTVQFMSPEKRARGRAVQKDLSGTIDRLISEWMRVRALRKAKLVAGTTQDKIMRTILEMNSSVEAAGPREIAREIVRRAKTLSRSRALAIARTETHAAAQNASLEVAKELQTPMMVKEWVAVEDSRTRDSHRHTDGSKVGLDDAFNVNGHRMSFPGDPSGPASEVVNCRCVMVYVEQGEELS